MGVTSRAEVWAFGPVAFAVDGQAQPVGGKPGTLLALLAFYGGAPVPQRVAAEAVWDRAALPLDSPRALRQVVRRLSPLLATGGTSVVTTPVGLALDLPADAVDVHRFRHLLQAGPIAELGEPSLRAALAWWHDDPFPELLHVPEVQVAIDELNSLRLDAVEALYELELQRAASYPLVAELERLVRLHPERERLWQQLATVLHRRGRRAEALRAIERCKRALVGGALSPTTVRLEQELLLDRLDPAV